MDDTKLDESLVWREDGCLADPALHAVADAELELLPEAAREHAEKCAWCTEQVGRIAMLSLEIEEALALPRAGAAPLPLKAAARSPRRQLPVVPIALALLTALTCKLPWLSRLDPRELGHFTASVVHMLLPLMLKLIMQLAHSRMGSALVLCSAAFLLLASALFARAARAVSTRAAGGGS